VTTDFPIVGIGASAGGLEVEVVRMTQVLSNLLVNAAKYTPGGGITLECRLDSLGVVFVVRDNGVGIASDMLGKVFDLFTRVDSSTGRTEGTRRFADRPNGLGARER